MKQDRSIFATLERMGVEPSDIFKGFMKALAELDGDNWGQGPSDSESPEDDETESDAEAACSEDFPMMQTWDPMSMNSEDPRLSRGMLMYIPEPVAVHSNPYQNHLLPFVPGMKLGEDY